MHDHYDLVTARADGSTATLGDVAVAGFGAHRWRDAAPIVHAAREQLNREIWLVQLLDLIEGDIVRGRWLVTEPGSERDSSAAPAGRDRALPWMRDSWQTWMHSWVSRHLGPADGLAQRRWWSLSALLTTEGADGTLWVKASPPWASAEPVVTAAIARVAPALVPAVVALDARAAVLVTRDAGMRASNLPAAMRFRLWEGVIPAIASMQRELATDLDGLRAVGCPERTLSDIAVFAVRTLGPRAGARVRAACHLLERLALPPSVHHWDCHSGNLMLRDGHARICDWSSGIAHPFFTLSALWEEFHGEAERARLRALYLEPWRNLASADELNAAVDAAVPLAFLYAAMQHEVQRDRVVGSWERAMEEANRAAALADAVRALGAADGGVPTDADA